jgi:hypothetical protein
MLADPESVPALLDAYRAGCEEAGREQGEIVLQGSFSWAPDEDEALENCRVWKGSRPDEFYGRLARPAGDVRARGATGHRRGVQGERRHLGGS